MKNYNSTPDEMDRRHLNMMKEILNRGIHSRVEMSELASRLLALRDSFHWNDPAWDFSFTDKVATLDSCSLASAEQIKLMGVRYQEVVQETVNSLQTLVEGVLSR